MCNVFGDLALQGSDIINDDKLVQFFSDMLARSETRSEPCWWGVTNIGANTVLIQDKPLKVPQSNFLIVRGLAR